MVLLLFIIGFLFIVADSLVYGVVLLGIYLAAVGVIAVLIIFGLPNLKGVAHVNDGILGLVVIRSVCRLFVVLRIA